MPKLTFEDERSMRLAEASPEERAPMSDDDIQSVAVDVAIRYLSDQGFEVCQVSRFARQAQYAATNPPALIYKAGDHMRYAVVTTARLPERAPRPVNPEGIIEKWKSLDCTGYWIGVSLAHELDSFDPNDPNPLPLMKGFAVVPMIPPPVCLRNLQTDSE